MTHLLESLEHYHKVFPQPIREPLYPILVIAHRGFSKVAPENTLSAFEKAIEVGADMIEFDIQLSKDNELVIIHDRTLKRTAGDKGRIRDLTIEQLKELDAGSWFHRYFTHERIPTLQEALELVHGRIMLNIEIKREAVHLNEPLTETRIIELLKEYQMLKHTIVSSFHPLALKRLKQMEPTLSTAYLFGDSIRSYRQKIPFYKSKPSRMLLDTHADSLNIRKNFLTKAFVKSAQAHGIRVHPFTVDRSQTMKKLIKLGVDGIITNSPDLLLQVLKKRYNR